MDVTPILNPFSRRQSDGTKELLDLLKNPYSGVLNQKSVYASLATSIGFTLLLAICFSLLRPYNSVVYAPKLKVADDQHAPPPMGKGMFAWVGPVLKTKEADLVGLIGLDATVFLRILRMCRNIFLVTSLIGCSILIPINLSRKPDGSPPLIDRFTPLWTWSSATWSLTICAWLINATVAGFLWWNYRAILKLRRKYYESAEYQASLHARTLMINDIPREFRSDEGIGRVIDEVVPTSSFSRTAIARNVKELPDLIEDHNKIVRELEKYLAKYLKNPDQLPASRPQCKPSKKDPNWGTYPKGQKVDAIEYLTTRIKELELEIKAVRMTIDSRNPLPYGFASYEQIDEAHSIAFAARKKHPQGTTIRLAPRPNDIIWKNMPLNPSQRRNRRLLNTFWIFLLTVVWIAPNAMISIFVVQLSNLGNVWPAFQNSLSAHTTWWSLVQGVASPALTSLVYLVLPVIFRRLQIRAGDTTKTARERHVTGKLYTFFIINYLIVFSFFSTIWSFVTTVISNTQSGQSAWSAIKKADIASGLFTSLCGISPFWITWLLQRNLGAAIDLAQLWMLFWGSCVRKFSSPTPREMIELTAPPSFDYASYYNYFLFYSTVALCYGFVQPLVLPACALYFCVDIYLKKYLLLYIFITKTESGGMFWRVFYNRMVFATILSTLVVFLATWVHGDSPHSQAYAVIPLPFLMLAFKWYCHHAFDDKIHFYAVRNMLKDPEATRGPIFGGKHDRLASRFGHPALYKPLITPMVHARAQNILAAIYGGRLTDSNNAASGDITSISGYSDTYALDPMRRDKPGKKASLPGFELVPEDRLDFAYFKKRAEFSEEHGGNGGIYGKAEDIVRPDTPGGQSAWSGSEGGSRPATPGSPKLGIRRNFTNPISADAPNGEYKSIYGQHNDSESNLVRAAADIAVATPPYENGPRHYRDDSGDRRAPGFLGGGPQGYGGLPQAADEDLEHDPTSYDYFRAQRRRD